MSRAAFSAAGLARLQSGIDHHIAAGHAPGAVGLVACADQVETFAVGLSEVDGATPMRRDTIFRIASMTKPITAVAVLMLVEEGRLRLDEPVERLLPELADRRVLRSIDAELDDTVPAARAITVRDLLTFQMGLGLVMAPPGRYPIQHAIAELKIVGFAAPEPSNPLDGDEWLRRLATLPLMVQPGTDWLYTTASDVQGVLISRASGRSLGDFLDERILGPLGMVDTAFSVPPAKLERFVPAYNGADGNLAPCDDARSGGWSKPPAFEQGDAGLVSTVDDYLQFARFLLAGGRHRDKQLLSEAAVAEMTRNHLGQGQRETGKMILGPCFGWGFGLGVAVERDGDAVHPGQLAWPGGLGTSWMSDPASGLTAILLTQRLFETPELPRIHRDFQINARKALG
jgi:CubicO group peptidase (beta-lactamase class C family)